MGISSCKACKCSDKEDINEFNSQVNIPVSNISSSILDNKIPLIESKAQNYNYNSYLQYLPNNDNKLKATLNIKKEEIKEPDLKKKEKEKEIKLFIKNFNIQNISFPIEKDKLSNNEVIIYENSQNILNKFFLCDDNELNYITNNLFNILFNIKNGLDNNSNDKNVIFSGYLKKLINSDDKSFKIPKYSDRFCVLYNDILKYYKSDVQFLKNLKPLSIIYLNQISRINLVKGNKNSKKLDHIILCNKNGILNNKNENAKDTYLNNECLIILTSNNEQDIYKWYAFLQYIINWKY